MDPMTIGAIVAAVATVIETLISLSQKSGELEKLFEAVLVELQQVLNNQLALVEALNDVQKTCDALVDSVAEIPQQVAAQLHVEDAYALAEVMRKDILDIVHSPNPRDPNLWSRLHERLNQLPIDAQKLTVSAQTRPIKAELYTGAVALLNASLDTVVLYQQHRRWDYDVKTLVLQVLRSVHEVLTALLLDDALVNYVRNKQSGTERWIVEYEAQIQKHPAGKRLMDLIPTGDHDQTVDDLIKLMSPMYMESEVVIENTPDIDDGSGFVEPGFYKSERTYTRKLISIPMRISYAEAVHGVRLITAKISGSTEWIADQPWHRVAEYSEHGRPGSEVVESEDPASIYAGYAETDLTPANIEKSLKLLDIVLKKRNALAYWQSMYLTLIESASRLQKDVETKIHVLERSGPQ